MYIKTELNNSFLWTWKQEVGIAGGFKNQKPMDFLTWNSCFPG